MNIFNSEQRHKAHESHESLVHPKANAHYSSIL